jgi:hypothetical protein
MSRYRTSIAWLIGFVGVCGAGLAALRGASGLSVSLTLSAALAVLTLGLAGIFYRKGRRRAFWVGFCICGWAYASIALNPLARATRNILITTVVLNLVEEAAFPDHAPPPPVPPIPTRWGTWTAVVSRYGLFSAGTTNLEQTTQEYYEVGHALFTVLLASIGGTIFRLAHDTRDRDDPSAAPTSSPEIP